MGYGEPAGWQDQPAGQHAPENGDRSGSEDQRAQDRRLDGQHRGSARRGGQCEEDHAGAVFAGHRLHGGDRDDRLPDVDAGEAELRQVLAGAR